MAYQCPRCGGFVQRGSSKTAGVAAGLVGQMIFAAFGSFQCRNCGPIAMDEFPTHVQNRMTLGSIVLVITATALFAGVIMLLITLRR